jgi:hypothetical protein
MMDKKFKVSFDGDEHETGNPDCKSGWCNLGYPKPCECGGLIHADWGDENSDGDYWLYTKCDKCGESDGIGDE